MVVTRGGMFYIHVYKEPHTFFSLFTKGMAHHAIFT